MPRYKAKKTDNRANNGRPTGCKPEYAVQAAKLCKLGARIVDLADFFDVSASAIKDWINKNEAFGNAVREVRAENNERVEATLLEKATGYTRQAEKIFCYDGEIIRAEYTEYYPPSDTAIIFWLKNRNSTEWKDRHESEVTIKRSAADLTDDELTRIATGSGEGTDRQTPSAKKPPSVH